LESTTVISPEFATCQLGKQLGMPTHGSTITKSSGGIPKMSKLEPGDLAFSNQYKFRLERHQFSVLV
jgi:hypothetical protein